MASRLAHKIWRVREMARKEGIPAAVRAVVRRLRQGPTHYTDVLRHYAFALPYELQPLPGEAKPNTLLWFIPDFNLGSGGHLNIFRTIWHLEKKGYTSTIVIGHPGVHINVQEAEHAIREHFFPLKARVVMGFDDLPASEFAVATGWDTAYQVRAFTGAAHKLYFVQDYEPHFFPVGSEYVLASNTYGFGFFGITAGTWLSTKLAQEYGMTTRSMGFGVERSRYRRLPRREPEIRRVFFYARPPTPRRAFEIGLLVLNEVWKRMPDVQFVLAGWDTRGYRIPFPHLSCGTVSLDDLPDLYAQCDVALVLSLTNASLLPLELMACGCAVVSNRGENVEWLLNDDVALLAHMSPEALTDAVCSLMQDDEKRRALTERAEAFANAMQWETVAQEFEDGLLQAREQGTARSQP